MELINSSLYNDEALMGYYRYVSGALTTDSSTQGHTLTDFTGTIANGTGRWGNGADLGASNSTKYFTRADNMGIDGGAFSCSFWVKLDTEISDGGAYSFFNCDSATSKTYYRVYLSRSGSTHTLHFIRAQNGIADTDSSVNITALGTTNWHHIVHTYDTANIRGYLDNSLITGPTAASGDGNNASTTNLFTHGAWTSGWQAGSYNHVAGILDDTGVFNKALSVAEIAELYLASSPSPSISPSVSPSKSPSVSPSVSVSPSASPSESEHDIKVLLHFNGDDTSTVFTDESGKAWLAEGTAQLDTGSKKFGSASLQLDGDSDYITTTDNEDFNFGTSDFTVDFWWATDDNTKDQAFFSQYNGVANDYYYFQYNYNTGTPYLLFNVFDNGSNVIQCLSFIGLTPVNGTFYHVALVRKGNDFRTFWGGDQIGGTVTDADEIPNCTGSFYIGTTWVGGAYSHLKGRLDEFRICGSARWTSSFPLATTEYLITESPSASFSPSGSPSVSPSLSESPSKSPSVSPSVSPSISPTMSPSISVSPSMSPSPSPGWQDYTKGDYNVLPANANDLENAYTVQNYTDVSSDNEEYTPQTGTEEFMIHQFKDYVGAATTCTINCNLKTTQDPSASTVYLQIWNKDDVQWDTLLEDSASDPNVDFNMNKSGVDLEHAKDASNVITCRVYQEAK